MNCNLQLCGRQSMNGRKEEAEHVSHTETDTV